MSGVFGPPCATEHVQYAFGDGWKFRPPEDCYRYDPPRLFDGLWHNAFEGSSFHEGSNNGPSFADMRHERETVWLSVPDPLRKQWNFEEKRPFYSEWRISFIGRKTSFKGHYGHMGSSDRDITVERIISAQEIEPKEYQAEWREEHRKEEQAVRKQAAGRLN